MSNEGPPIEQPDNGVSQDLEFATRLRFDAYLEEYRTLRQESLQGINARHQVVTFTFGALSVIIAGLLTSDVHPLLLGFLAMIAVPQIAKAALLMWLGEYRRSARAGSALREIETQMNNLLGKKVLTWESTLTVQRGHMTYPYSATVLIILFVSYSSSIVGVAYIGTFAYEHPVLRADLISSHLHSFSIDPLLSALLIVVLSAMLLGIIEGLFWKLIQRLWKQARV